jgi:cation:H+ antiporter
MFLFIASIVLLWFGSGLSINSVEKLSKYLKLSSFLLSFYALGILTSTSEISVGVFSIIDGTPSVSVGNLLGASVVLTLFVIPLLALANNGLKFAANTSNINLPLCYLVISLPTFLILDKTLSTTDALIMLTSYLFLSISISFKSSVVEKLSASLSRPRIEIIRETLKALLGVTCVVIASKLIVDMVIVYSVARNISPFIIGLLVLSIGTNLPEISILIRSTLLHKKEVALGDYVGSAALNTFLLSIIIFLSGGTIYLNDGVNLNVLLLPAGSLLFLYFVRNKRLERFEGLALLILYAVFIASELFPLL